MLAAWLVAGVLSSASSSACSPLLRLAQLPKLLACQLRGTPMPSSATETSSLADAATPAGDSAAGRTPVLELLLPPTMLSRVASVAASSGLSSGAPLALAACTGAVRFGG